LLNTVGSQTLTIRGSDKSTNGKLFEKLVLGSLLSILGFTYETTQKIGERVFWLSSQSEKRESDATLIYKIGQGGLLPFDDSIAKVNISKKMRYTTATYSEGDETCEDDLTAESSN